MNYPVLGYAFVKKVGACQTSRLSRPFVFLLYLVSGYSFCTSCLLFLYLYKQIGEYSHKTAGGYSR